jgi:hypothetical protein
MLPPGRLRIFAYVNEPKAPLYRAILRAFMAPSSGVLAHCTKIGTVERDVEESGTVG